MTDLRILPEVSPAPLRVLASVVLATLLSSACSKTPPPENCGDSSMSIVTFQGRTSDEDDEIRSCIDIHAASRLDATATSRGRDDSFATSRPTAIPWTNVTFEEAVGACARAGKFLCNVDELRSIAVSSGRPDGVTYDETEIQALSPTSDVTSMPHQFTRRSRYDLVIGSEKIPYPESAGSVAFWTASPEAADSAVDPRIPLVLGRIRGSSVAGGVLETASVLDPKYKHPLLGFRCCIHAKMRAAFTPLAQDPRAVRETEDKEVPLATP